MELARIIQSLVIIQKLQEDNRHNQEPTVPKLKKLRTGKVKQCLENQIKMRIVKQKGASADRIYQESLEDRQSQIDRKAFWSEQDLQERTQSSR